LFAASSRPAVDEYYRTAMRGTAQTAMTASHLVFSIRFTP